LNVASPQSSVSALRQLFGDNRAEWPVEEFRELFVPPTYLAKLMAKKPSFLVGGRGTGKTTSLQSLRFDAADSRFRSEEAVGSEFEFFGILVRMNKNRVRAFQSGGLDEWRWSKLFAHYFNLLVCAELTALTIWLESRNQTEFPAPRIERISRDLGLKPISSSLGLAAAIRDGISELQLVVNNPARVDQLLLSMAESPLRVFCNELRESGLIGDCILFCCIDEYENLLDYQQAVLNTYIKHAEPPLSYKVGVRKNGLRNRQTLDGQDLLKTPDDYAEIEIAEEGFDFFAKAVAELRLRRAVAIGIEVPTSLGEFLEELTIPEEAILLGAGEIADEVLAEICKVDPVLGDTLASKSKQELSFLKYWQESQGGSLVDLAADWMKNKTAWQTRIGNYAYASLFWLSKGKGNRIRKYYAGERTLLALASGNIRYFLELIDEAIGKELPLGQGVPVGFRLSAKSQTFAARDVGLRKLNQLEGLADHGVQLKRLVLAVGKVFFEMARTPSGKTPEVTSFVLNGDPDDLGRLTELLSEGVGHLAFEAEPRTKPTSNLELRDEEYRLHRIFSAFFEISHRKKRRTVFSAGDLLAVLESKPAQAISRLLNGTEQSIEAHLPEQLAFFSAFYDGGER